MSSDEFAISIEGLSKYYQIYDAPRDRLKQFLLPRFRRLFSLSPKTYFTEFKALDEISFQVRRGETVGIVGRNGSGKSTLLQLLCGTLSPTKGDVHTKGRIAALLELGSGFNPEFTGIENIYLNATVLGLTKSEIDEKLGEILDFADIGPFVNQPIKTYSSGMIVRLAFAVIAHVNADILIIDEALSVGDAFFVQKCMRFLREFMSQGTVLFVSHDTGAVINLCDRAVWLHQGRVEGVGSPKEITELYLARLYEDRQGGVRQKNEVASGPVNSGIASAASQERNGEQAPRYDMRLDFINGTSLRNDIELFRFQPESISFGLRGIEIENVEFLDLSGRVLSWVVGGSVVQLRVRCKALQNSMSPIVGFSVKDRLGQPIFADNTFLSYVDKPIMVAKGDYLAARFEFVMPILPTGDYSISAAVAEGSQDEHVQHHWIHDALTFKVHASSVCLGLMGVPMRNVSLEKVSDPLAVGIS